MSKRTFSQIERDFKRIRQLVETSSSVESIEDIAKATGLTKREVTTSLSKHPRIENQIRLTLQNNRKNMRKADKKAK